MDPQQIWDKLQGFLLSFGPRLFAALAVFAAGWVLVRLVMRWVRRGLERSKIDLTLRTFLLSLIRITLIVLLFVTCAVLAGIPATSLVTALGAVGLAVSLAVKDSLSHLAGGMILLATKPFSVGNYIETDFASGSVHSVGLFYTELSTPDNKRIFVPNGQMSNAKIVNFSTEENRRLDLIFPVSYGCDIEAAKAAIARVVAAQEKALSSPEPLIRVTELAGSSVEIACRVWVKGEDYWDLRFDLLEQVKAALDREGIPIPFPQLDVHLVRE